MAALLANAFVLGILAFAATLEARDPSFYYRSLQEDGYLEWSTFWAFLLAGVLNAAAGVWQWRREQRLPWFGFGLALFCFFVAMEEISWGQRLLGFRAPSYFLEHNYQQELNLHNVVDTGLRKLVLQTVILGYGVALPLLARVPTPRAWLQRLGVGWPSPALIPAFLVTGITYAAYPWQFTGEVVELMLGLGFLFDAMIRATPLRTGEATPSSRASLGAVALLGVVVLGLGVANDVMSRSRLSADPAALEAARVELAALDRDLHTQDSVRGGRAGVRCGVHKRLYGFVVQNGAEFLRTGHFVDLMDQGLPEQRADFLIDPWGSPYWLRFSCSEDGKTRSLFLYSFGPNRLRDSSPWEILGDDVGVYVQRQGEPPGAGD